MTKAQKRKAEKMQEIKEMFLAGRSREEIAAATGYKLGTVEMYLTELGLRTPDRCENHIDQISRWWKEGKSLEYISQKIGFSKGQISKVLKEYGYQRRKGYGFEFRDPDLIDANTMFADRKVKIFRCIIYGKRYIDVSADYL